MLPKKSGVLIKISRSPFWTTNQNMESALKRLATGEQHLCCLHHSKRGLDSHQRCCSCHQWHSQHLCVFKLWCIVKYWLEDLTISCSFFTFNVAQEEPISNEVVAVFTSPTLFRGAKLIGQLTDKSLGHDQLWSIPLIVPGKWSRLKVCSWFQALNWHVVTVEWNSQCEVQRRINASEEGYRRDQTTK